jgi:hypothetical protein
VRKRIEEVVDWMNTSDCCKSCGIEGSLASTGFLPSPQPPASWCHPQPASRAGLTTRPRARHGSWARWPNTDASQATGRSPWAFRAAGDMPLRLDRWLAELAAPSEADSVSEALPAFSPRRFAQ